jgi:hypothetical protein
MMRYHIILLCALSLLLPACSGLEGLVDLVPETAALPDLSQPDDTLGTSDVPDTVEPEEVLFPETVEVSEIDVQPLCAPGDGCFLDPCGNSNDCQSGLCVDHLGDSVCSMQCVEECPQGWLCEQIGSGPDTVFACISPFTHLCRPCHDSEDCQAATGVEDVCIDYGGGGNFCGADCPAGSCPEGYNCQEATTTAGAVLKQCVNVAGVCSCSATAVKLGLSTPCSILNDQGLCTGFRFCTEDGLSACDALIPAPEECNGLDDNCDGQTDETTCDDTNPCTEDSCDGEAGCVFAELTGTECFDGDVCTLADHCDSGECVGTFIDCDDGNVCTTDTCDPSGGCLYAFNSAACDDADPCTVNDMCKQGSCNGFAINCECYQDSDCQVLEDGDICNGTLLCDTSQMPHTCIVDTQTIITCPLAEGMGAECLSSACHPLSGECSFDTANEGINCNDEDPCTVGEGCGDGECSGGVTINCNDGNPCTTDVCTPGDGCEHTSTMALCDDGDACTVGDQCLNGVCQAGGNLACNDNNDCTADSCDAAVGCVHVAVEAQCDDGNPCTLGDHCVDGACKAAQGINCDDDNPCTNDICDPGQGCVHMLSDAPCDDQNVCTTSDHCHLGECISSGQLACQDVNPCTDDSCEPDVGCVFKPNQALCDDGNVCTGNDTCAGGICKPGISSDCDDDNPCTDDYCDFQAGCIHVPNTESCNNDDLCTANEKCKDGMCGNGFPVDCADQNLCTDDSCDPATGCVYSFNQAPCDDNDACTEGDACAAGLCVAGPGQLDCDDLNFCTDDSCAPGIGCEHVPNMLACDDQDSCTDEDVCAGGTCVPGASIACDDGDECTTNTCAPDSGCVYVPISPCCGNGIAEAGEGCDDGNDVVDDGCEPDCSLTTQTVPGFNGVLGPEFDGWLQCEGYFDQSGGDDIPQAWGDDCASALYSKIRLVCGANVSSHRYIDVSKNVFKDGLTGYSQTGLIYNASFSGYENIIYANENHPHNSVSWWGGGAGCGETNNNTTINNGCPWEASNCFGQGISGSRYLWLYVQP